MAKAKNTSKFGKRHKKTKDKADGAEMRKASLDTQQIELKSDDFDFHFKNTKAAKVRMGTAKSAYDACLKAAKKVSDQLHASVKLALSIEGKDLYDVKTQLEVFGFVLKVTDHPLQLTIHDTLLGDVSDAAFARGGKAGAAGMPMANPYPDSSDLAARYADGWGAGQASMSLLGGDGSGMGHNSQAQAAE